MKINVQKAKAIVIAKTYQALQVGTDKNNKACKI